MIAASRPHPTTRHPAARAIPTTTYRALPELRQRGWTRITALAAAAILLASPATAQQPTPPEPSPYTRAIAAGYKALTLCSGIFNARESGVQRSRASIETHELRGIYREYDAIIGAMPSTIDEQGDRVLVEYDPDMPPRVARVETGGGCTILPIGVDVGATGQRLRFDPGPFARAPWRLRDETKDFASGPLRKAVDGAFAGSRYGNGVDTTAVIVTRDGRHVAERYARGFTTRTPQRTWSVAKSMAGTLLGIGVNLKLLDVKLPAPIPEWQHTGDPRRAITLDHLLRMASGLYSPTAGNRTDAVYFGGTAVTEETVAWPLIARPNSTFRYANNDILLAVRALEHRYQQTYASPLPANVLLFARLDMADTYAEQDWRGNYILSSQVWSTARDLARLGQFWLQDGVWQGKRLLPEGWMRYMTTPSGPQPATGPGYGATMWLFGPAQGLPAGSYAAQGNRGQYVMVIPSKKLVIVRRGEDPGTARFDIARFAADVIAATP
ncbi:MAG TPA: serine hydrolase [Sphingomonas sp.]|jgi:CubicO group peptidase (beta-lactamase class C family)